MTGACGDRPAGIDEAAATFQAFSAILVCITTAATFIHILYDRNLYKSTNDSSQTQVQGHWMHAGHLA